KRTIVKRSVFFFRVLGFLTSIASGMRRWWNILLYIAKKELHVERMLCSQQLNGDLR
ncbi:hypothetical protein Ancab_033239, partial [Ancistrocladus abbreviatus]